MKPLEYDTVTIRDTEAKDWIEKERQHRGDTWPATTAKKMVIEYGRLLEQQRITQTPNATPQPQEQPT